MMCVCCRPPEVNNNNISSVHFDQVLDDIFVCSFSLIDGLFMCVCVYMFCSVCDFWAVVVFNSFCVVSGIVIDVLLLCVLLACRPSECVG